MPDYIYLYPFMWDNARVLRKTFGKSDLGGYFVQGGGTECLCELLICRKCFGSGLGFYTAQLEVVEGCAGGGVAGDAVNRATGERRRAADV